MNKLFKTEGILQFILFLINPFLGLLSSLYYMFKKSSSFNALSAALSLSLIFIYLPIMYDSSSRFYLYYYQQKSLFLDVDLYNKIIIFLHQLFNVQYMSVIYLYTVFIVYMGFFIFKYYKGYADSNKTIILMCIYLISSILYRNIMDLERFYLGVSIILFTLFLIENKIKKINFILITIISLLAVSIHSGVFLVIVLFLIARVNFNLKILKILPILAFIFASNSFYYLSLLLELPIFSFVDSQTMHLIQSYIDPNSIWGSKDVRFSLIILRYIEVFLLILIYYKGVELLKNQNTLGIKITLLLAIVVIIFLPYVTLYERYSTTFYIFSIFIVYPHILEKRNNLFIYLVLFLFILRSLFVNYHIYGIIFTKEYNDILPNEDKKIEMILKPFYYPTPILLWIEENGYSDAYIKRESTRGKEY